MSQALVDLAIKNIWQIPGGDKRWVLKPTRITPKEGDLYSNRACGHQVMFPTTTEWYHLWLVGLFNTKQIGIDVPWGGWLRADDLVNKQNIQIKAYGASGRTLPLSMVWLRVLENNALIVATRCFIGQLDLGEEDLYLRFYDGLFNHSLSTNADYKAVTNSKQLLTASKITDFVNEYRSVRAGYGYTFCYVDGYPVPELTVDNLKLGSFAEYIRDPAVIELVKFPIKKLPTFNSALDGCKKYLLHPPVKSDTISFKNDVELYITDGNTGRYFFNHELKDIRQLTHRDLSIPTERIQRYITDIEEWYNNENLYVWLFIRNGGLNRPIVYENNRIKELYKLDDAGILGAMVGIDATLDLWRASNLESSAYVALMSTSYEKVDIALATQAYGYNAAAYYLSTNIMPVINDNGLKYVDIPVIMKDRCTVYEYNSDGILLEYHKHLDVSTKQYFCNNAETALVEIIPGYPDNFDLTWDAVYYQIDNRYHYRYFLDILKSGESTRVFEDVTDTDSYSIDSNGVIDWNYDETRRSPVVWSDKDHIGYSFTAPIEDDGLIKFTIQQEGRPIPAAVIPECVEIWMNGFTLTQGLDYTVVWPQVIVCAKEYLKYGSDPLTPVITVRCRNQATAVNKPNYGYVINGLLSNNTRWDVRDDKPVKVVIDGKLCLKNTVSFREDLAAMVDNGLNGLPYFVDDPLMPLRDFVSEDTYALRKKAKEIDKKVEDVMSVFYPQTVVGITNPITKKHTLFSPFLNKIIYDLINGYLNPVEDDETRFISTAQFDILIEPYLYLLNYEPAIAGIDLDYIDIEPHARVDAIALSELHFSMVARANDRYLANAVTINQLLKVKG